jgi:preprotein translocase subunit YajC
MRSVHFAAHLLAATSAKSSGNILGLIIPFGIMGVAMYFLLIRPQKRRQRAAVSLQSSIEVGDEVMTTSGVYGFVTAFEGDIAWLEIDDNVQIRIARQAIQRKVDTTKGETAVPTNSDAPAPKAGTDRASTDIDDLPTDES